MEESKPKLSIIIPIHDMKNGKEFLWKSINILTEQTFKDFELIITKAGRMAENTNEGIKRARGEIIKILYLDDVLANKDSLQTIVEAFNEGVEWLVTGADNNQTPYYTHDIKTGNNRLGSPSCLAFRNHFKDNLLFDENMSWLLDCDLYKRMYTKYGEPKILTGTHVIIGVGDHQMTHILTDEDKQKEHDYILTKQ